MLSKKRKRKAVFGKLLNDDLDKGDFVEFPHGKVIWKVAYRSEYGLRIVSLNSPYMFDKYFSSRTTLPFYKVTKDEAIRFMCLKNPSQMLRDFTSVELREYFKRNLKEV